jgi:ABC-type multidrug transport system permease subunit
MRRFWILLRTEVKAWRKAPISILGGFIAPGVLLVAFGLLFGGRLSFQVAVIDRDAGRWGAVLRETFDETISPFGTPYYDVAALSEEEAWAAYRAHRIDGIWVIPEDFSARLEAAANPQLEMVFSNYNDDRAKNHRIYAAEILWRFYEKADLLAPPLALAEVYPRDQMVHWFPLIGVGLALFGATLGGMFNIFLLTYREQVARITLEFGLAPRSLAWVFLPKALLALAMGLVTGTALLGVLHLWVGAWPGRFIPAVWLLMGLVTVFWIVLALLLGLRVRHYMAGAVAGVLGGAIVFFIGGGMASVRYYAEEVLWIAWLFPNTHAIDAIRELVLFQAWPADWRATVFELTGFALLAVAGGMTVAARRMRRLG